MKPCKDCDPAATPPRPTPHPGPRCATHHRAAKKASRAKAHARRVMTVYGITADEYWAIYESQGGRCFVCQRATGATKRLAVDHEHGRPGCTHAKDDACRDCVRCLACGPCNRELLGRYDVAALRRAIAVLLDPPAQHVLVGL